MNPNVIAQTRIDTPLGPLTAVATARGLAGLWFDGQRHHPGAFDGLAESRRDMHLEQARRELAAYFERGTTGFCVALDPQGTAFQQAVWRALVAVGHGATASYGQVARALGRPEAARAVGAAVGRNPVGIVIPCHRIVGSGGALTGYAGGLDRKRALLALEASTGALLAA